MKRIGIFLIVLCLLAALGFGLYHGQRRYWRSAYPLGYSETVEQCAATYDLPPSLVYAVIYTESHFKPDAVSSADAKGLMQLTDNTLSWALQRLGQKGREVDLFNPADNIFYGCTVLSLLSQKFENGDTVLAAYNAGQGNVARWLGDAAYSDDGVTLKAIPYTETRNFVVRVRDAQERYRQLYDIE